MRIFLILLFTITCANLCNPVFSQFSSTTIRQIDQIKNNNGTDIVLDPTDKVMINYFTGGFALQSTVTGELQESSITNTELNYLSGTSSNIQDQLDLKEELLPWMDDGDLVYYDLGSATALSIGTNGQILTVSGGLPSWQNAPVSTTLTAKGDIQTHNGTANATLTVGTNGQILKANSATATGLEWVNDTSSSIFSDAFLTLNDGNDQANADGTGGLLITMTDATDVALNYDSGVASQFVIGEIGDQHEVITAGHTQSLVDKTIDLSSIVNPVSIEVKLGTQAQLETHAASAVSGELAYATDTKAYYGFTDNALVDLGGNPSSQFNNILNPTPKIDTSGWVRYKTTSPSATPDDFAGVPNGAVTWTRNTTNALNNVSDFLLTKDANNRQGEGVYYQFDIRNGDKTLKQLLKALKLDSANVTDSDISLFLVTSSDGFVTRNIIRSNLDGLLAGTRDFFKQFQLNSTDTEARLCVHIASANALAYTIQFNDFFLGLSPVATSAVVLDEKSYTPSSYQGLGTPSNVNVRYSQVGDKVLIQGRLTAGTTTAAELRIALPNNYVSSSTYSTLEIVGTFGQSNAAAVSNYVTIEPNVSYITVSQQSASNGSLTKRLGSDVVSTSANISFNAVVKIQGLSSNAASSIDLGAKDIKSVAKNSATTAVGAGAAIHFANVTENTGGVMWTSSTQFTPIETSDYLFSGMITATAAINTWNITVYNVTDAAQASEGSIGFIDAAVLVTYSGVVKLVKGKTYEIRSSDAFTPIAVGTQTAVIKKLASPQTMFSAEYIGGKYSNTSGQAIANNTATTITNWTVTSGPSTSAAWMNTTTGITTIQLNGVYDFFAELGLTGLTTGTGDARISIEKNGTPITTLTRAYLFSSDTGFNTSAKNISCIVGDTITVRLTQTNGASRNLSATSYYNSFSFIKVD